ncbi:MAG: hypothetical protein KJ622_01710 [Alphaproteobacteria bacterium]|nr:hypothetical protein [Alphaproteobacteria bacterium]
MTVATSNEPTATVAAACEAKPAAPQIYASGTLRKLTFSFVFLLMLPFFVSLGPMLFARVAHGHWIGTPGLILLTIAFATVMGLLVVELVSSIRSRVVLGDKAARIRLPQSRGPMSLFSYKTFDVPYADIAAVEMRREIYGGSIAPVIMKGARVVLKDGSSIKLGYVNERNVDPAFPFAEIGERIAARANVPIVDVGDVRRSAFKKTFGLVASPDENDVLTAADVAAINHRHGQVIFFLVGLLILLVGVGIFSDINSDIGHANLLSTGFGTAPGAGQ